MDIEDYIKIEEQKMTWLDKVTMNYPKAKQTISLADTSYSNPSKSAVIKPSIWDKTISVMIVLFLSIFWVGLLNMVLAYKFPFAIILLGWFLVTFLIFLLIRNSFFNKKYIYNLTIDNEGISVDKRRMMWSDISDTFIMSRQEGKHTNQYLLVFKTDKTVDKLDLFRMATSDRKLATIIEHYKQKANAQQAHWH